MSDLDEIAKQVELDRARLALSLDALTETVKPQNVAQDVTNAVQDAGGDLAQKALRSLRDQPAGGLLVSLGLGLLAAGADRKPTPAPAAPQPAANDPMDSMVGFDARVAAAEETLRKEAAGAPQPEASKLKAALNSGLEQLPPKARMRVVRAREAVISAQESVERQTKDAKRKTSGFIREQPLAAGALAVGFGILAGALLPGTRREDALLGARRDALMADARRALDEELVKAEAALVGRTGS